MSHQHKALADFLRDVLEIVEQRKRRPPLPVSGDFETRMRRLSFWDEPTRTIADVVRRHTDDARMRLLN